MSRITIINHNQRVVPFSKTQDLANSNVDERARWVGLGSIDASTGSTVTGSIDVTIGTTIYDLKRNIDLGIGEEIMWKTRDHTGSFIVKSIVPLTGGDFSEFYNADLTVTVPANTFTGATGGRTVNLYSSSPFDSRYAGPLGLLTMDTSTGAGNIAEINNLPFVINKEYKFKQLADQRLGSITFSGFTTVAYTGTTDEDAFFRKTAHTFTGAEYVVRYASGQTGSFASFPVFAVLYGDDVPLPTSLLAARNTKSKSLFTPSSPYIRTDDR